MDFCQSFLHKLGNTFSRRQPIPSQDSASFHLRQCLGLADLAAIGISSTLGSGVYVLTGSVAKTLTGPAIVISYAIAAFASLLSGICYAEFGARMPGAGSAYSYAYISVGELCAFVIGWNMILEYVIGGAAIARGLSGYVDSLANGFIKNATISAIGEMHVTGISNYLDFFALLLCLCICILLVTGMKNSAWLNNGLVLVNLAVIIVVVGIGSFYTDPHNWSNFAPFGFSGIMSGASSCFYAFIGFDVIATTGEEAMNPSRNIPLSIMITIIVCFVSYVGTSAVVTLMVPYNELVSASALASAFSQKHVMYAKYIVGIGAAGGLLGCNITSLLPLPRLLYAMANDGLLFKIFAKVSDRTAVPIYGTIFTCVFTGLIALIVDLEELVEMLSIGTLLAYTFVVISVLLLRYQSSDNVSYEALLQRNDSLPGSPIIEGEQYETTEPLLPISEKSAEIGRSCVPKSDTTVKLCVSAIVAEIIGLCSILAFRYHHLVSGSTFTILSVVALALALISTTVLLCNQEKSKKELVFEVPFVPWLPVSAILINVYLLMKLHPITWIRFVVWMTLGFVLYFSYGIRHSKLSKPDILRESITLNSSLLENNDSDILYDKLK